MPTPLAAASDATVDAWAGWKGSAAIPYTVGLEEEVMLLGDRDHVPVGHSDAVIESFSSELRRQVSAETHAGVLELKTGAHADAAGAVSELSRLRRQLVTELRETGVVPAAAGMHPLSSRAQTRVSDTRRYRALADSLRWLARREPTMALHVHVGVRHPHDAVRLLNRLRESVALLIALSANSPLCEGRLTGFESTRTAVFGAFPRTGTPRAFAGYADYVRSVGTLVHSGAIPDATHLWWDVRLQPRLGTVELRALDAQTTVADTAALVALVQSLARLELEGGGERPASSPEVVDENRFLAARDGLGAELIDAEQERLVPVRRQLSALVAACRRHAVVLGCEDELASVHRLADANGAVRQRGWLTGASGPAGVVLGLKEAFLASGVLPPGKAVAFSS